MARFARLHVLAATLAAAAMLAAATTLAACDAEGGLATGAQAEVLAAARDAGLRVADADVVYFVTPAAGAAIDAGALSATDAARMLDAALRAEEAAFTGSVPASRVQAERARAAAALRAADGVAATDSARTAARRAFEAAYAQAYPAAGRLRRDGAFAAQALARALANAGADLQAGDELELCRQARRLVALSTTEALRHAFAQAGASDAVRGAVEAAGVTWLGEIGRGTSVADFDRAHVRYNGFPDGLHTPLVLASGVSSPGLTASEIATLGARSALGRALRAAPDGVAVGRAVRAYYAEARALLRTTAAGASELATDGVLLTAASAGVRDGR